MLRFLFFRVIDFSILVKKNYLLFILKRDFKPSTISENCFIITVHSFAYLFVDMAICYAF